MTQVIEYWTKPGIQVVDHQLDWFQCGETHTYRSAILQSGVKVYNTPEHRAYPSVPFRAMTSRDAFTRTRQVRIVRNFITGPTTQCGYPHSFLYEWDTWLMPADVSVALATPDWALAMRNKIDDDKVNFAESIGEWRESVKTVAAAADVLHRAWWTARDIMKARKNRRVYSRWFREQFGSGPQNRLHLTDAVSMDLAMKWGIQPLADQVYDTLSQYDRLHSCLRRLQVTLKTDGARVTKGKYGGSEKLDSSLSVRAIAWVKYDPENRDFTAGNLAESLWAGTPLSFVLDWWIDISSYLHSFTVMQGVEEVNVSLVKRFVDVIRDDRVQDQKNAYCVQPGLGRFKRTTRSVLTSIPFATYPSVRRPETDLWKRLFSLTEVLVTLRGGRGRHIPL